MFLGVLFCCCCFVPVANFLFYLDVFVFFFKLIDRVFVMKWQSDYSSQTMSFTQDEISEVDTALSTLFGASLGCLPKARWAPKFYLLFFYYYFSVHHEIPCLFFGNLCCLLLLCCLYPFLVPLAFSISLLAFLCSSSFICAIPWSFMLKRHDLTASFQESQMKWA